MVFAEILATYTCKINKADRNFNEQKKKPVRKLWYIIRSEHINSENSWETSMVFRKKLKRLKHRSAKTSKIFLSLDNLPSREIFYNNIPLDAPGIW